MSADRYQCRTCGRKFWDWEKQEHKCVDPHVELIRTSEISHIQDADEYQGWAVKTLSCNYGEIGFRLTADEGHLSELYSNDQKLITDLLHAALGMETESGEFADPLKKHIFYGKALDFDNLREELGDLLWYIAIAADALDTSLSAIMTANIKKLSERYPDKAFNEADAVERKDKTCPDIFEPVEMPTHVKSRHTKCAYCGHDVFYVQPREGLPALVSCDECNAEVI